MLKINISFLIETLVFQFLFITLTFAQRLTVEAEPAKIKTALTKRGTGKKSKVKIKLRDGREKKTGSPN